MDTDDCDSFWINTEGKFVTDVSCRNGSAVIERPRFVNLSDPRAGYEVTQVCNGSAVEMLQKAGALELRDAKHGKALLAGDVANSNMYHQDRNGRANALFRFIPAGACEFQIVDAKHNLALVAGDAYNAHVYHQQRRGQRPNARWVLWRVEKDGRELGYILRDAKHRLALVAGDAYNQNVYHQTWSGRLNAVWGLFSAAGQPVSLPR
jgi:hypothetical protein